MSGQWEAELARQREAKRKAQELGNELLTPGAVEALFGVSATTVRTAKHKGRIWPLVTLALRWDIPLFLLRELTAVWGEPKDAALLKEMRDNGHTLGVPGGALYNVLNPQPLVTLRDPAEMGGDNR